AASTGFSVGRPSASPTSRSTSPKAGARWTMPEPSTVDEVGDDDAVGVVVDRHEAEGPLVVEPGQVGGPERLDDRPAASVLRAEHRLDPVPAEDDVALHA